MNIKKYSFFAATALLCAQAPAPSSVKLPIPQAAAPSAAPAAEIAPDAIVLKCENRTYTAKEFKEVLSGLSPQEQQAFKASPQVALSTFCLMEGFAKLAKEAKLHEESPHKEQLAAFLRRFWAQAYLNDANNKMFVPKPEEEEAYYEKNKGRWETASISVIQLNFASAAPPADPKAKKYPTEEEARTKAAALVSQIRGGADFEKLARENSDDKESAAQGGKYATIRRSDKFPPEILKAVFDIKAGEVTDPIRQNGYFYVVKVTEKNAQPLKEVRDQVFNQLKQERFQIWMQEQSKRYQASIEKPEFFK